MSGGPEREALVLWAVTETVPGGTLTLFRSWLPPGDRPELSTVTRPGSPRDRILAGGLLRLALSRELSLAPPQVELARDRRGKPHLVGVPPEVAEDLAFSVSYSGGAAACVLFRGPEAGIDLESTVRPLPPQGIRETFLTSAERTFLETLEPGQRDEAFIRFWTLKEAFLKARGMGLAVRPGSVGFQLPLAVGEEPSPEDPSEGPETVFFQRLLPPRWIVSVALRGPVDRLRVENLVERNGVEAAVLRPPWIPPQQPSPEPTGTGSPPTR